MAGLYQQWLGLRGAQDNTEGELEEERDARDDGRTGLEWALFDALLAAARRFQKEPDALKRYFNHTLLDAPRHASRERQAEAPAS
ncbi:MAG: hypothetical protein EOO11_21400 [Chitinophagaceae bacterium]|nr:MAG: hypothetical protein EOO11_21400 [Chitinophagaceae bacterium]